jgi:hypothetical protein
MALDRKPKAAGAYTKHGIDAHGGHDYRWSRMKAKRQVGGVTVVLVIRNAEGERHQEQKVVECDELPTGRFEHQGTMYTIDALSTDSDPPTVFVTVRQKEIVISLSELAAAVDEDSSKAN